MGGESAVKEGASYVWRGLVFKGEWELELGSQV